MNLLLRKNLASLHEPEISLQSIAGRQGSKAEIMHSWGTNVLRPMVGSHEGGQQNARR